jgi:hypothetical protein
MHMQIGMLSGVLDIHLQFLIFGLTGTVRVPKSHE